jgi:hypothetical protein
LAYGEKEEVKRIHKVKAPNKMREVFIFVLQLYKAFSIVATFNTTAVITLRMALLHDTTIHAHVTGMAKYDLFASNAVIKKVYLISETCFWGKIETRPTQSKPGVWNTASVTISSVFVPTDVAIVPVFQRLVEAIVSRSDVSLSSYSGERTRYQT